MSASQADMPQLLQGLNGTRNRNRVAQLAWVSRWLVVSAPCLCDGKYSANGVRILVVSIVIKTRSNANNRYGRRDRDDVSDGLANSRPNEIITNVLWDELHTREHTFAKY
jgi:hypothetical protein